MAKKNIVTRYADLNLDQKRIILSAFIDVMLDPAFVDAALSAIHKEGVTRLNTMILSDVGIGKTAIPDYNWAKTDNNTSLKSIRKSINKWNNKTFTMHFLSDDNYPARPRRIKKEAEWVDAPVEAWKEYDLKKKYISTIESNMESVRHMLKNQLVQGIKSTIRDVYWFAKLSRMYGNPFQMDQDWRKMETLAQIFTASKAYSREELAFELTARKDEKFDTSELDARYIYFTDRDAALDYPDDYTSSIGVQHNIAMSLGLVPDTKEHELGARKYAARVPVDAALLKDRFIHEDSFFLDGLMYNLVPEHIPHSEFDECMTKPIADLVMLAFQRIAYLGWSMDKTIEVAKEIFSLAFTDDEAGSNENILKIQELCKLENLKYVTEEIWVSDPLDKNQLSINYRRKQDEQEK